MGRITGSWESDWFGKPVASCVASSTPDWALKSREVTKLKGLKTNRLVNFKLIRNRQVESSTLSLGSNKFHPEYYFRLSQLSCNRTN
jgi:hypothetical protein